MSLFFSAWQLVVRRSLANWRLLSTVLVGVLVAVALLSSTPLYSNALNDLGLSHALHEVPIELLDVHIYAPNYPIDYEAYQKGREFIDRQASRNIKGIIRQEERYIKSQTFYAAWADRPILPDAERPTGHFQVFTNLEEHVTLVEGRFADPFPSGLSGEELADPGLEIEAVIGSETAEIFDVGVGDRLLFWSWRDRDRPITIELTGIIDPVDPEEEYWFLRTDAFTVPSDEGMVAPLFIQEQTLFEGVGRIAPYAIATYNWFYFVDLTRVNTQNAGTIANAVQRMERQIITELPRSSMFTRIRGVITTYQHKQLFTQIPLFLLVFQVAGIILYYLVTVANMVIERQTGEIALLRSRGASTWQIIGVYFVEGLLISAFGGAVGPFLGAAVFSFLGRTAPFLPLTGGGFLPIRFSASVFQLAAGAALLCLLALLVPAIQAARRGVVHQRQQAARPPRAPFWQRFYLDLVLLAFGGALFWELRERGSLLTLNLFGGLGMDPLLLVTPMLLMVAVAIVFLRLFPIVISLVARIAGYITNAPAVLSLRYMARNPIHYGRLILLLMMAASVGMFSASFLGTLERSYNERAMYTAGSDVRLEKLFEWRAAKEGLLERYSDIPGVEDVSLAYRGGGRIGSLFTNVEFAILAIDPESFARVAWYRNDFSEKSLPELMDVIVEDRPVKEGLDLPEGTERIGLWVHTEEPHPELRVFARIQDGLGYYVDSEIGAPASDGWQYLEGSLRSKRTDRLPRSPLSLHCLYVKRQGSEAGGMPRGIYLDDLQVRGSFSANPVVIEDFEDVREWTTITEESSTWASSRTATTRDTLTVNREVVYRGAASGKFSWVPSRTFGRRGIYPNLDTRPLTIVASRSLLERTGTSVGSKAHIRLPGQYVAVVIRDVVDYFPTLDPDKKAFIIANLDRATSIRNRDLGTRYFYPNEAWLTVTSDEEKREAALSTLNRGRLRAHELYDKQEMIAESKADPLVAAGWGGILLIAFLGVILVSGLGFVVYAYLSARGRQLEFAILRTLGFSFRQIIGLVCFEQLFVIGAGMGIGTLIGLRLSTIMMPFLQLTERGERVLPPFIPVIDWSTIGIAYIILAIAFLLTISLVVLFFSRVALHRVLRIGDE